MIKKFVNEEEAAELISKQGFEFAVIHNPEYIYPPIELYPLAKKITTPREKLSAIVMDMDGTTTTTEELCIHSLEYMVRQISGKLTKESWKGLDPIIDYPNIIGNSTTKHVEYLITRYNNFIDKDAFCKAFFHAALWTLILGQDKNRKDEVTNTLINLGCKDALTDEKLNYYIANVEFTGSKAIIITNYFFNKFGNNFTINSLNDSVRAAIDIYYQRYHEILELINKNGSEHLKLELLENKEKPLIEPTPGVGIFLALIKGWLGEEIEYLMDELILEFKLKQQNNFVLDKEKVKINLLRISKMFQADPLKIAVVTSSIFYEANIVMGEVFHILLQQVDKWNVSPERKKFIKEKFTDYNNVYDAFITASDSSEIRLKPHRDLYSIALYKLGIPKVKFEEVVGFEDSESGTIAIRAAGMGLCVAVPFAKTKGHDMNAATYVLNGGLPETLIKHNLFIKE
ncbi:MAG: hypothetical protein NTX22_01935 [Ignavibacteriales bacterium]|nr:hypothetical protein [Ignavibacteriales bacterium]